MLRPTFWGHGGHVGRYGDPVRRGKDGRFHGNPFQQSCFILLRHRCLQQRAVTRASPHTGTGACQLRRRPHVARRARRDGFTISSCDVKVRPGLGSSWATCCCYPAARRESRLPCATWMNLSESGKEQSPLSKPASASERRASLAWRYDGGSPGAVQVSSRLGEARLSYRLIMKRKTGLNLSIASILASHGVGKQVSRCWRASRRE